MTGIIKLSEAVTIAFHTIYLIYESPDKLITTKDIAEKINVSENHLSKVLQRLVKARLIDSIRGPKGGFKPNVSKENVSLLEVYEAIEGPFIFENCLLGQEDCISCDCLFGDFLVSINRNFKKYLESKNIKEFILNAGSRKNEKQKT